jgi:TonB-linked SusC/RagA family outer membrane protein
MYLSALCKSRLRDYRKPLTHWGVTKTQLHSNKTIILAMKLTAILLFAACLQVSAKTYSQTVTLNVQNAPLDKVVKEIEKQTKVNFFYEQGLFQNAKPVTVSVNNSTLEQTLELCFRQQPFEFKVVKNTVFIKKKELEKPEQKEIIQQVTNGDITGRVTTVEGEPLAGANVIIKRTGTGTVTNANGQFILIHVNSDDVLLISYVGYTPLSIKVAEKTNFMLVMHIAINKLDAAVVQAYGKTTDRLRTGNISRVTSEDIEKQPVMNVLNVLQGQIPGAVIKNVSGYSSATVKVEIRGRNTINPNFPSDPLYIIDGVPLTLLPISGNSNYANGSQGVLEGGAVSPANGQSPFFNVNPGDIESIEVLKDADATAIYGSRGSNGVILITTKRGKLGKTHFDLNVSQGMSEITRYYSMLNTKQYVQVRSEALTNDGFPIDINFAPDLAVWDTTRYTNWQKYLWGSKGQYTNIQSSISGGNNQTTYRIGGSYTYQRDILAVSGGNHRGSLSINLNTKSINQRFSLSFSSFYTVTQSDLISMPLAAMLPPNAPSVYDNKGNLNYSGWTPLQSVFPFGVLMQPYNAKTNLLNSNLTLGYQIYKGLQFSTSVGYNNILGRQISLLPIASQNPLDDPRGMSTHGYTIFHNLIVEPQLTYKTIIGKNKFDVLVGGSAQKNETNGTVVIGSGYKNDLAIRSISAAPTKSAFDNSGQYSYAAAFARINYNIADKYIVNLNGRRDGSSRFGPGKQFGNFGSVAAAWVFSEENWLKNNIHFLSFGKLRGSYGITGGDQISDYSYLSLWTFQTGQYNGFTNITPNSHVDSLLKWAVNKKLETGLMLGVWDNRILLEASWYRNRCGDQLVYFPTPSSTGFTSVASNLNAVVENSGWEFTLNTKIVDYSKFKLSTKLLLGINKNRLVSYPNVSSSPYAGRFVVGQPLNIVKLLHWTGIDPQTGDYTFEDKNKDGQMNIDLAGKTDDDRFVYNLNPKFDGGFTTELSYKGFDLSIFFYFKKQMGYNATSSIDLAGAYGNQSIQVLNRWSKPGDVTSAPKLTTNYTANFMYYKSFSDANLCDASFIRLQNLSLSYTLPKSIVTKFGNPNIKIFAQGQNLLLITNYDGIDPEVQNFGGLPLPKIFTFGLSCNF